MRLALWIGFAVVWLYLIFVLSFYGATAGLPDGYSCRPTITFGYTCTAPDGHTFGGR